VPVGERFGGIRVTEAARILAPTGDHAASSYGHASVSRHFRNVPTMRDGGTIPEGDSEKKCLRYCAVFGMAVYPGGSLGEWHRAVVARSLNIVVSAQGVRSGSGPQVVSGDEEKIRNRGRCVRAL
jgi:hypothetical protein